MLLAGILTSQTHYRLTPLYKQKESKNIRIFSLYPGSLFPL